jgi:hypothetical protein
MPFVIIDPLQHKRNERQRREIHQREYVNYIERLQQQNLSARISRLSLEHERNRQRSHSQRVLQRQHECQRIEHANQQIAERRVLHQQQHKTMDRLNSKYFDDLAMFQHKALQHRLHQWKQIGNHNVLFAQRLENVRSALPSKQQHDNDWQRHVNVMKRSCLYPENLVEFLGQRAAPP